MLAAVSCQCDFYVKVIHMFEQFDLSVICQCDVYVKVIHMFEQFDLSVSCQCVVCVKVIHMFEQFDLSVSCQCVVYVKVIHMFEQFDLSVSCQCVVYVKVIHMFEQFDLSDVVIALVKLAIGIAEYDDPHLVCCVSAHFHYKQISLFTNKYWSQFGVCVVECDIIYYTVFQKKHPLILLAISWGVVVWF